MWPGMRSPPPASVPGCVLALGTLLRVQPRLLYPQKTWSSAVSRFPAAPGPPQARDTLGGEHREEASDRVGLEGKWSGKASWQRQLLSWVMKDV